jgi:hypothetical protein
MLLGSVRLRSESCSPEIVPPVTVTLKMPWIVPAIIELKSVFADGGATIKFSADERKNPST